MFGPVPVSELRDDQRAEPILKQAHRERAHCRDRMDYWPTVENAVRSAREELGQIEILLLTEGGKKKQDPSPPWELEVQAARS